MVSGEEQEGLTLSDKVMFNARQGGISFFCWIHIFAGSKESKNPLQYSEHGLGYHITNLYRANSSHNEGQPVNL